MSVSTFRAPLCLLLLGLLVAGGCGDRLRVAHRINLVLSLPALRAVSEIEDRLDEETLERVGGRVPDTWPDEVPPIFMRVPIDVVMVVEQPDLQEIGEDLSRVSDEEFELRLRGVDWFLDPRDINHPIDDVEIWVGPEDALAPGGEETTMVGYLDRFEEGQGEVAFAPGGRRAFADRLLDDRFAILVRATMVFDTEDCPERPKNSARLNLTVHLDVLR